MSFDWSDFLGLAESLSGQNPQDPFSDEAKWRAAAGRAYYAAYWAARSFLERNPNFSIPPNTPTHRYVIEQYTYSSEADLQDIGIDLDTLKVERTTADYDQGSVVSHNDAVSAIDLAKKIIDAVDQLTI